MSDQAAKPDPSLPGPLLRLCRGVMRLVARLALAALILLTLYLSAGRLLLPRVGSAGTVATVEAQLSALLGIRAHIDGLEGSWRDFTPQLRVGSLLLEAPDGTTHRIDDVSFAIDVWRSLAGRALAITGLSVRAVELAVEQGPDGRWALAGTRAGPGGDYSRQILRFLLNTPDLSLSEATIAVRPRQGETLQLHAVFARIENDGATHRAQLQFRLDEQPSPSRLLLEMDGMPDTDWTLRGWLTLPQLELRPLAQPVFAADWDIHSAAGNAALWFDATSDGAVQASGLLRDVAVQADSRNDTRRLALQNGSVDFNGQRAAAGDWMLTLSDTGFDWGERTWSLPAFLIERPDAEAPLVRMRGEGVELGMANALALDMFALPERAAQALRTLQPEGTLYGLQLDTALDGSYPNLFQLRGHLSDGVVQAWNAAPAGSGVDAWVQADVTQGVVEVDDDDLQLHLPQLFDSAWHYAHVNGRVRWQLGADGEVSVWSRLLDVTSPDLDGRVGFSMHNWEEASGERDREFKLLVGVERMAVVPGKVYLPSLERLANTMGWLQDALQGGTLHDSAFMLRSSRSDGMEVSSSAQSWYRVEEGRLQYLQQWPALEQAAATVLVRDNAVDVQGRAGSIAGMALEGVSARVRPEEDGSWLHIQGRSNPDTTTGHRFLLNSPLHETIGASFDTWQGQGSLQVALDLGIPLGDNPRERAIDVQVVTHDSALQIPEFALDFSAIDGTLHYSLAEGLRAQDLSAQLFGEPVMADIVSAQATSGAR
ncbi:MAG TPA: DUF3971 domain-containing protein, partial [Hyphomicrobiales bacterium]|nr:DUF3971 domain-containing protein [Hyphomicrobiales bacterium]